MFTRLLIACSIFAVLAASPSQGQESLPAPPMVQKAPVAEAPTSWLPQSQTQVIAPYAGHVNHAHTSPTFRWGWFGAEHYYPGVHWHENYVGDRLRWSKQRRY